MTLTTSTGTIPASAASPAAARINTTSAREQQDRFMTLLVAQMKNQDPLNPMDNAQMTSQIAQINTVGGLEKLNRTMETLLAAFQGLQGQSAVQLPGRDVLVEGHAIAWTGEGGATGGVSLPQAASALKVEVLDASGTVVRTLDLGASPAGVRTFTWDGTGQGGDVVAAGHYRMRVTAADGALPLAATPLTLARVKAVTTGEAGVQLDLGPLGVRPYTAVRSFL